MSFELSPDVDKAKIFLVNWSDLQGRLDPVMVRYNQRITQYKYKSRKLGTFLRKSPQYGANEAGIPRENLEEPRYIRITDIDEYGLLRNKIGVTAEVVESKYMLSDDDILFARSGATVGKTYIHKTDNVNYKCFFAGYMIRFVIDPSVVDPDYIFAFTQLKAYEDWVHSIQRAVGQPNINAEEYGNLFIPVPPPEIQNRVVTKMDAAYTAKKQKETEAQQLLGGVDDYLLAELGIEKPAEQDNILKNRMYYRKLSEVTGDRFDPRFHGKTFVAFFSELKARTDIKTIGEISVSVGSGSTPKAGGDAYTTAQEGVPFIRIVNLKDNTVIVDEETLHIKKSLHKGLLSRTQLEKGDVLLSMAGTIGLSVVVPDNLGEANINQAIARIKLKSSANSRFISEVLNSEIGKLQTDRLARPAVQANINLQEIRALLIPLPNLEKQNKIAEHIAYIRQQAKQLQQEASEGLERAKLEVEAMILGEEA